MLIIFIDSTAYKAEPTRLGKNFIQLAQLAERGFIQIHISEINVGEVLSWIEDEIKSQQKKISDHFNSTIRFQMDGEIFRKGKTFLENIQPWYLESILSAKNEFETWLERSKVFIHPIKQEHSANVWKAYFSGAAPFKTLKSRKDIPDAFVWQVLNELSAEHQRFYFLSDDREFRESVEKGFSNVVTFSTLTALSEDEAYKEKIREWEESVNIDKAAALSELIGDAVEEQGNEFGRQLEELIESRIWGKFVKDVSTKLRGEISEIRIHETPQFEIDWVQVKPKTAVYIKFTADLDLTVDVALPRWGGRGDPFADDYMNVDRVYYNEDILTDTHMLGQNDAFYKVSGDAVIEFPFLEVGADVSAIGEAVSHGEIRITEIKFESDN